MEKKADIHFRVSKREKEHIVKLAKENNQSISEYARTIIVNAADFKVSEFDCETVTEKNKNIKHRKKDIRLTEQELNTIINKAETAGISSSEYIRKCINRNVVVVIPGIKDLTKQVIKIGVNLNQLTLLAHQGSIKEVDLFSCKDSLDKILDQLIKLREKGDRSGNDHVP